MKRLRYTLLALTLSYMLFAPWLIWTEYHANKFKQAGKLERYIDKHPIPLLNSVETHYAVLIACDQSLMSVSALLMPQTLRTSLQNDCLSAADKTLRQAPSMSLAHLLRAEILSQRQEKPEIIMAALQRSENLGGELTWMAARRIDLALRLVDNLDVVLDDLLKKELSRMLRAGHQDALRLAKRYRSASAQNRNLLRTIVEDLPDGEKKRFLSAIHDTGPNT